MEMFSVCITCIIIIAGVRKTYFCYGVTDFRKLLRFLQTVFYVFFHMEELFALLIKGTFSQNKMHGDF